MSKVKKNDLAGLESDRVSDEIDKMATGKAEGSSFANFGQIIESTPSRSKHCYSVRKCALGSVPYCTTNTKNQPFIRLVFFAYSRVFTPSSRP
jgi:hypothetical protein